MNIIEMVSANHELAKRLSTQQIMTLFEKVRDGKVLSFENSVKLVKLFGTLCWQLENEQQQEDCFMMLHDAVVKIPQQLKGKMASELMSGSINYPRFVFLASELINSLPPGERKEFNFYPLNWTYSDEFTLISSGEYAWRKKRDLPCGYEKNRYHRPLSMLDLLCFEVSLDILYETESEVYLYIG